VLQLGSLPVIAAALLVLLQLPRRPDPEPEVDDAPSARDALVPG
jgi:hypothetical protein